MARSKQSFGKREKEKERLKKKALKQDRREERKKNSLKGMGLDALVVDPKDVITASINNPASEEVKPALTVNPSPISHQRTGRISYYNEQKGYGFVRDSQFKDNIMFRIKDLTVPVKLNDSVTYTKEKSPEGNIASGITLLGK